jgi:hypothetical protein
MSDLTNDSKNEVNYDENIEILLLRIWYSPNIFSTR